MGIGASLANLDAWENGLFDRYNGEGRITEEEYWANVYEEDMKGEYNHESN